MGLRAEKARSTNKRSTVLRPKDGDSGYVVKDFSTVNGNMVEISSSEIIKVK